AEKRFARPRAMGRSNLNKPSCRSTMSGGEAGRLVTCTGPLRLQLTRRPGCTVSDVPEAMAQAVASIIAEGYSGLGRAGPVPLLTQFALGIDAHRDSSAKAKRFPAEHPACVHSCIGLAY